MAGLAHPEATPEMVEVLAKDQFINALPDKEFRLRLRQSKPETLQQALEQALDWNPSTRQTSSTAKLCGRSNLSLLSSGGEQDSLGGRSLGDPPVYTRRSPPVHQQAQRKAKVYQPERKRASCYWMETPSLLEVQKGGPHPMLLHRSTTKWRR